MDFPLRDFLLQIEDNGHYSEDTAVIERIISEKNWFSRNGDKCDIYESKFSDLNKDMHKNMIPVGSIEFVNKVLSFNGKPAMKPINIPDVLMDEQYLSRKVQRCSTKDEVYALYEKWNKDSLFVKSDSGIKTGNTDIYKKTHTIFDDSSYFVSEVVDFVSEYRCFVNREQLKGIKNYLGDEWVLPSKDFVMDCISKIGKNLTAYTLDVGILPNGKTAVIEVHNFVSCGLYGFDHPVLTAMITNGYKTELLK